MLNRIRSVLWFVMILALSTSLLMACSGISLSGGIIGSIISLVAIIVLFSGILGTQTSCHVGPCLSIIQEQSPQDASTKDDPDIGPCLSLPPPDMQPDQATTPDVGPCLQPLPPDTQPDQATTPDVGPCLSPPPPDIQPDQATTPDVGPCLSPLPPDTPPDQGDDPDVGPCLSPLPPDTPPDQGDDPDVGPCLSPPPPDLGPCLSIHPCLSPPLPPPDKDRTEARACLSAALAQVMPTATHQPSASNQQNAVLSGDMRERERQQIINRLQQNGTIPACIAQKLKDKA